MRYLVYFSYIDLKGKEQLRDNTCEAKSEVNAMNHYMLRMGSAGYTNRSIDQVIPMTPTWKANENEVNVHVDTLIDRGRGKRYTEYEKEFIFQHYSVEGPRYCAAELGLKEQAVKAYANRERRLILENRLDLPIEAFTAPKTKQISDTELTRFNKKMKFQRVTIGGTE